VPSPEELLARVTADIVVHIPLAVALGASDDVAQLDGHGVVDPATARLLAAAAPTWQRLFIDADGVPLALGRTAYRPPRGLRRYLEYRDGTCRVPGCTRPAHTSEADHTTEWQDGGTTDAVNLALLCPRHHALKSLALFRLKHQRGTPAPGQAPDTSSELLWQTLLGHEYPAEPADRSHILGPVPDIVVASSAPPRGAPPDEWPPDDSPTDDSPTDGAPPDGVPPPF
jgi:hypothetical protein